MTFIRGDEFFHYHGLVLGLLWMFGIIIGILVRKTSRVLHALSFIIIDYVTLFFLLGAIIRVYPHIEHFPEWSLIKQGHIVGGKSDFR